MALEQISVGTKAQYIDRPDIPANKKLSYTEVNDIVNKTKLTITQVNTNTNDIAANEAAIAMNSQSISDQGSTISDMLLDIDEAKFSTSENLLEIAINAQAILDNAEQINTIMSDAAKNILIETTAAGVITRTTGDVSLSKTETGVYVYTVNNANTVGYVILGVNGTTNPNRATFSGNVITVTTANGYGDGAHSISFQIIS